MGIIIDIILLGIIAFCVWKGYTRGLILSVSKVIGFIIAIYAANLLAHAYAPDVSEMLSPFVTGIVDSSVSEAVVGNTDAQDEKADAAAQDGESADGASDAAAENLAANPEGSAVGSRGYDLAYGALRKLGVAEHTADKIASEVGQTTDGLEANVAMTLSSKLCDTLAYIAVFTVASVLIIIVLTVIANIINLTFGLPGLDLVNKIGGSVFGGLSGVIIVVIIAWVCRFTGLIISDSVLEKSIFLKWMMNANLLEAILGV